MDKIIRKAVSADRPYMMDILKEFNMHHIPSEEIPSFDITKFYVAVVDNEIIGLSGYEYLSDTLGKTTLMAVSSTFKGTGIGKDLQEVRLRKMYKNRIKTVITNSDRPNVIAWYKKHYGYEETGLIRKYHSFGLDSVDHWTTLKMDLVKYFREKEQTYIENYHECPLVPYKPLIINSCLTGMIPRKHMNPNVPISTSEIIEDAVRVYDAGASIVHIHARDQYEIPTSDPKYFEEIIIGIRKERPDMICCATTSGRNVKDIKQRAEVLQITGTGKPDMASLTLGSLNFINTPSINSINDIEYLAMVMEENGIKPELEVFDIGMINLAKFLERKGILNGTKYFNIILGNINTADATLQSLSMLYTSLPDNSIWAGSGLGIFQLPMNTAAIIAGGNVRVGIEDSIFYDIKKQTLTSNVALVDRIVEVATIHQRSIASSTEARSMIFN